MKFTLPLATALTLAFGLFGTARADEMVDPAKMTCAALMAMDATGMMAAGAAVHGAMMEDAAMAAMTDDETMKAAEAACKLHPDAMVMDAMKM